MQCPSQDSMNKYRLSRALTLFYFGLNFVESLATTISTTDVNINFLMITGRDRGDFCLLEQKLSETEHIYRATSAGLKNLPLKSEATLPVAATRLV